MCSLLVQGFVVMVVKNTDMPAPGSILTAY